MNKKIKTRIKRVVFVCLVCFLMLFVVSAVQIIKISSNLYQEEKAFAELSAWQAEYDHSEDSGENTEGKNIAAENTAAEGAEKRSMIERYDGFHQKNPDFAGWICIDGTKLNYPVMFTPENPEYYLHRSFDKKDSVSGVPFIGDGFFPDGNHRIIYGHNMKNGTMFATLLKYKDREFWRKHPEIQFDDLYEENTYEIIGAFYSKVYSEEETGVFKYYQYSDLSRTELFDEYYDQVKKASLYDTGVEARFGDEILTLSTCSYHVSDGRFVVVARKKREK